MNLMKELVFGVSLLSAMVCADTDTWKFVFDINTGGGVKNEGTEDTVIFRLMRGDEELDLAYKTVVRQNGLLHSVKFEIDEDEETPTAVEVHIEGNDAMMIDRAWIKKNGNKQQSWGMNNDQGWCLSEDPGDADGAWSGHTTECLSGVSFMFLNGWTSSAVSSHNSYGSLDEVCFDLDTKGVGNEKTEDSVAVMFLVGDRPLLVDPEPSQLPTYTTSIIPHKRPDSNKRTTFYCHKFERVSNTKATSLQLQINGWRGDALMIDRITLNRYANKNHRNHYKSWGIDNDYGWCLSTDPNDINGGWSEHADGCYRCIHFKEDGSWSIC